MDPFVTNSKAKDMDQSYISHHVRFEKNPENSRDFIEVCILFVYSVSQ